MELRRADEARLDALRREGAAGSVQGAGVVAAGGPLPPGSQPPGYWGRPVLKAPPWTWEVPLYLFVGGAAGSAAVIAFAARAGGHDPALVRDALLLAVGGVLASAALLVSDLGRPARFLHMLRVFKWRSPMSVGVWLLTAFGGAATTALGLHLGGIGGSGGLELITLAALAAAAALGAGVATYTGVLLAGTVIPVWNRHAALLPAHFGAAALGSAGALLELAGHAAPALHWIGTVAAAVETVLWAVSEAGAHAVKDAPLRSGRSGWRVRAAALLTGPAALLLRLTGLRTAAAAVFLLGALASRFAWLAAGRASADDPRAAL